MVSDVAQQFVNAVHRPLSHGWVDREVGEVSLALVLVSLVLVSLVVAWAVLTLAAAAETVSRIKAGIGHRPPSGVARRWPR